MGRYNKIDAGYAKDVCEAAPSTLKGACTITENVTLASIEDDLEYINTRIHNVNSNISWIFNSLESDNSPCEVEGEEKEPSFTGYIPGIKRQIVLIGRKLNKVENFIESIRSKIE